MICLNQLSGLCEGQDSMQQGFSASLMSAVLYMPGLPTFPKDTAPNRSPRAAPSAMLPKAMPSRASRKPSASKSAPTALLRPRPSGPGLFEGRGVGRLAALAWRPRRAVPVPLLTHAMRMSAELGAMALRGRGFCITL